ncbi:hypothetical protein TNCV_2986891 [Trichonephila clavipes]|nr:hypothetical protein TNCV_2986891 [Trichonephila clavipes]
MSKSPDRKRLTELGSPPIPDALWIAERRLFRHIIEEENSFDSQKTSLAGLALESATSSGLGKSPRSAMQDPIQAPPGTTRQAGLYTS